MSIVRLLMTPPPAARAPPLRGVREGEGKNLVRVHLVMLYAACLPR